MRREAILCQPGTTPQQLHCFAGLSVQPGVQLGGQRTHDQPQVPLHIVRSEIRCMQVVGAPCPKQAAKLLLWGRVALQLQQYRCCQGGLLTRRGRLAWHGHRNRNANVVQRHALSSQHHEAHLHKLADAHTRPAVQPCRPGPHSSLQTGGFKLACKLLAGRVLVAMTARLGR